MLHYLVSCSVICYYVRQMTYFERLLVVWFSIWKYIICITLGWLYDQAFTRNHTNFNIIFKVVFEGKKKKFY